MLMLPYWSAHPRHSPLGSVGVLLLFMVLVLALKDVRHFGIGSFLSVPLALAALCLCLFSLLNERSKLYGYTGAIGSLLYSIGAIMALLVGPAKLHW